MLNGPGYEKSCISLLSLDRYDNENKNIKYGPACSPLWMNLGRVQPTFKLSPFLFKNLLFINPFNFYADIPIVYCIM